MKLKNEEATLAFIFVNFLKDLKQQLLYLMENHGNNLQLEQIQELLVRIFQNRYFSYLKLDLDSLLLFFKTLLTYLQ
jgi:hypothetical protein